MCSSREDRAITDHRTPLMHATVNRKMSTVVSNESRNDADTRMATRSEINITRVPRATDRKTIHEITPLYHSSVWCCLLFRASLARLNSSVIFPSGSTCLAQPSTTQFIQSIDYKCRLVHLFRGSEITIQECWPASWS